MEVQTIKSPITKLPRDLLYPVVQYLHEWDLRSLMLTCKSFYSISETARWISSTFAIVPQPWLYLVPPTSETHRDSLEGLANFQRRMIKLLTEKGFMKHFQITTLTYSPDARDALAGVDDGRILEWVRGRINTLLASLSSRRLTTLTIGFDFLEGIDKFENLKYLFIEFYFSHRPGKQCPQLPSLKRLYLKWMPEAKGSDNSNYANVIVLLSQFSTVAPNAQFLRFEINSPFIYAQQPSAVIKLSKKSGRCVSKFMKVSRFPRLTDFEVVYPISFITSKFELETAGSKKFFEGSEVFDQFLIRHREQMKSFVLNELRESTQVGGMSVSQIPLYPNLETLALSPRYTAMSIVESNGNATTTQDYLQLILQHNAKKLRKLKLGQLFLAPKWQDWIKKCILPFENLTILKIHDINISAIYEQILEPRNGVTPSFPYWQVDELRDILPKNLQELSLQWWSSGHIDARIFSELECPLLGIFEELKRLKRLKAKVITLIRVPIPSTQVIQIRRRPYDYMNPSDGRKKVCLWQLEPAHLDDEQNHLKVWNYCERNLPGTDYVGEDAMKWRFDTAWETKLDEIRNCRKFGEKGCRNLLNAESYWVASPHDVDF